MSAKVSLAKKEDAADAPPARETAPASRPASASKAPDSTRPDGLTLVIARNSFYAANAAKMMQIFLGQLLIIAVMCTVIYKLMDYTDSRDHFFPAQSDNTLILERPLSEPVYSNEQVRAWVENAVTHTMTFGFYDHLLRLQSSRNYFTTEGWAAFTKAMSDAQIFERIGAVSSKTIKGNPQVVVARLRSGDRAKIVQAGVAGGRYTWKLELNIDITFNDRAVQSRFTWKVDVTVSRLPTMESREGIGISQMIATAVVQ